MNYSSSLTLCVLAYTIIFHFHHITSQQKPEDHQLTLLVKVPGATETKEENIWVDFSSEKEVKALKNRIAEILWGAVIDECSKDSESVVSSFASSPDNGSSSYEILSSPQE